MGAIFLILKSLLPPLFEIPGRFDVTPLFFSLVLTCIRARNGHLLFFSIRFNLSWRFFLEFPDLITEKAVCFPRARSSVPLVETFPSPLCFRTCPQKNEKPLPQKKKFSLPLSSPQLRKKEALAPLFSFWYEFTSEAFILQGPRSFLAR